jgi:Transposase DDE domain group 1
MSSSQTPLPFPLLPKKPVEVGFTGGSLSSDGGLLLLAQLHRQIGLTERADCLSERRLPKRTA